MTVLEAEVHAREVIGLNMGSRVRVYLPGDKIHGALGWVVSTDTFNVEVRLEGRSRTRLEWLPRAAVLPVRGEG